MTEDITARLRYRRDALIWTDSTGNMIPDIDLVDAALGEAADEIDRLVNVLTEERRSNSLAMNFAAEVQRRTDAELVLLRAQIAEARNTARRMNRTNQQIESAAYRKARAYLRNSLWQIVKKYSLGMFAARRAIQPEVYPYHKTMADAIRELKDKHAAELSAARSLIQSSEA